MNTSRLRRALGLGPLCPLLASASLALASVALQGQHFQILPLPTPALRLRTEDRPAPADTANQMFSRGTTAGAFSAILGGGIVAATAKANVADAVTIKGALGGSVGLVVASVAYACFHVRQATVTLRNLPRLSVDLEPIKWVHTATFEPHMDSRCCFVENLINCRPRFDSLTRHTNAEQIYTAQTGKMVLNFDTNGPFQGVVELEGRVVSRLTGETKTIWRLTVGVSCPLAGGWSHCLPLPGGLRSRCCGAAPGNKVRAVLSEVEPVETGATLEEGASNEDGSGGETASSEMERLEAGAAGDGDFESERSDGFKDLGRALLTPNPTLLSSPRSLEDFSRHGAESDMPTISRQPSPVSTAVDVSARGGDNPAHARWRGCSTRAPQASERLRAFFDQMEVQPNFLRRSANLLRSRSERYNHLWQILNFFDNRDDQEGPRPYLDSQRLERLLETDTHRTNPTLTSRLTDECRLKQALLGLSTDEVALWSHLRPTLDDEIEC